MESEDKDSSITTEPYDFYLNVLIEYADKGIANVPVTLLVRGALVSGTIISGKEYMERFAAGSILKTIEKARASGELEPESENDKEEKIVRFVHMRDANIVCGGSNAPIPIELWRGRLASVDGYTLGAITSRIARLSEDFGE